MLDWPPDLGPVLIDSPTIEQRVCELGDEISRDYRGKSPLTVGVLRGAAIFHADLIRALSIPLRIDFMAVASYGNSTETSGEVKLVKDLETSIHGSDVILVEDIVDSGLTLSYLLGNLKNRKPNSIRVCSLLSKPARHQVPVQIDYLGFEIPDEFVVGYGLDYGQRYRNLPHIVAIQELI